jgi:hypothetical protein
MLRYLAVTDFDHPKQVVILDALSDRSWLLSLRDHRIIPNARTIEAISFRCH